MAFRHNPAQIPLNLNGALLLNVKAAQCFEKPGCGPEEKE